MIFRLRRKRQIIRPKIEQGGRFLHSAVLNIRLKPLAVLQVLSGGFRFVCLAEYQKSHRPWGRGVLDFSIVRCRAACGAFFRLTKKYTRRIGRTLFALRRVKLQSQTARRTSSTVGRFSLRLPCGVSKIASPVGEGVLDFSIVRRRAACVAFFRLTKKYTRRVGRTLFATDFTKLQNPERCRTASIVSFGIFCFLRYSLKSSRQMITVAEYLNRFVR